MRRYAALLRGALLATASLAVAASPAHGRAVSQDLCLAPAPLEAMRPDHVAVGCDAWLAATLGLPRRTLRATAVVFTTVVWPEVSVSTVLNANTGAAPGDYTLTAGVLRVTARVPDDAAHVNAAVEVTNHTTCQLLLDFRFLDGGEYVTRRRIVRVRAGRDVLARQPVVLNVLGVELRTPLTERTAVDEFAAEFAAHFVECDRRLRLRQI